jgi:regulatory protein YycH of two-component signal transduction system YycFG
MKLQELVKLKKTTKPKRLKILISEAQFRVLSNSIHQNILIEQEQKTIKNTHLINTKSNEQNNK